MRVAGIGGGSGGGVVGGSGCNSGGGGGQNVRLLVVSRVYAVIGRIGRR